MRNPITIFGGTGFIGCRLIRRLRAAELPLRVVARRPPCNDRQTLPIDSQDPGIELVIGDVGQVDVIERAIRRSSAVVNLIGTTSASGEAEFYRLHRDAPARMAEAARAEGVTRFLHISAMGVSSSAPSAADRSKAAGEVAIVKAFADANLVRPSLVYGRGDHFLSLFVSLLRRCPLVPLIGGGGTRFEPMHVDDIAGAILRILETDTRGRDFDLGGPETLTLRDLLERLAATIGVRPVFVPVPFVMAEVGARCVQQLPGMPPVLDRIRLLRTDKTHAAGVGRPAELGCESAPLAVYLAQLAHAE